MAPKCFLTVLAMLLTIARADIDQGSIFSKVKEISVITNEVTYMPPVMILGKEDGSIVRCPHATPKSCEVYYSGNSSVTATVVHGEFLFAALKSGNMLRCSWHRTESCSVFNQADSEMTGLAVAAGYIHAGLRNGTILRCSMNTQHSCWIFANLGREVTSLAASNSFIYVGSVNNVVPQIDRCDISGYNCSRLCVKPAWSIATGLAVFGDKVYGIFSTEVNGIEGTEGSEELSTEVNGITEGTILSLGTSDVCKDMSLVGGPYKSLAAYNGKLYTVREDVAEIRTVQLSEYIQGSSAFTNHNSAVSISFAYGTYAMQEKYRAESTKCIWRGVFTCPPTVMYYDNLQHRAALEVTVKDGKLFDSQGLLVDTSNADESHSQRAAIFVMGPDGQILVSNVHKTGLLHTSSLLAGNPVSGAGLMVVEGGKIRSITACSVHYRPDQELNEQVRESLRMKGYTDTIDFRACSYNAALCILDETNGKSVATGPSTVRYLTSTVKQRMSHIASGIWRPSRRQGR